MPDRRDPGRSDPVDRAHLTGASRPSPPIYRYPPSTDLSDLVERYWVPVWSLTAPSQQTTLQHPVCLVVVSHTYARLYGVARGRSTVTLEGHGWAVGAMLRPAAGALILGRSVAELTDTYLDLEQVTVMGATELIGTIREAMAPDAHAPPAHRAAIAAMERWLRRFGPLDRAGGQINDLVDWLADHPDVTRVSELASYAGLGERTLQRLVLERTGLSPKWLIQRRRLHDAVLALKDRRESLSAMAARLGYADQAHFTHDFRAVTGMTPGEFLRDQDPRADVGALSSRAGPGRRGSRPAR